MPARLALPNLRPDSCEADAVQVIASMMQSMTSIAEPHSGQAHSNRSRTAGSSQPGAPLCAPPVPCTRPRHSSDHAPLLAYIHPTYKGTSHAHAQGHKFSKTEGGRLPEPCRVPKATLALQASRRPLLC